MRTFKLLMFLLIFAVPAMADSVWNLSGAITMVGRNACGGPPCVETLAFSFDVEYQREVVGSIVTPYYSAEFLPGASVTSFGPLGAFQFGGGFGAGGLGGVFIPLVNAAGDEIDLIPNADSFFGSPTPGPPQIDTAIFYSCVPGIGYGVFGPADPVCVQDGFGDAGYADGFASGSLQYTVTAAPESSSLSYLLVGLWFGLLSGLGLRLIHPRY
jgi:hypothetical protein